MRQMILARICWLCGPLATVAALLWAASASAATVSVDVSDDAFQPRRVEVTHGDRVVFENRSTILHSVHLAGRVYRFGTKHFIRDVLIYPRRAYVFEVPTTMKPGTYTLGCGLHSRMRSTMVVRRLPGGPKLLREGERWKTSP